MILSHGNIVLRPWRKSDADQLPAIASCKEIADNLRDGFPHPYTIEDANKWLSIATKYNRGKTKYFAIEKDGVLVGSIGVVQQEDIYRMNAEIGYFVGREFWGQGIVSAALRLIIPYIFDNFDVIRIYAEPYTHNLASRRVLEKNGFICEAVLKNNVIKNNVILDSCIYSLLKENYKP